uniref:Gp37 protein n=1 Tax=Candidatus Kentrum sp. LFY TaxID=2126342 RepID=A0A450WGT7_9GAMM|nr:MAG: Gp37 protein [Candidatus Kentron sp. LFY]
MTTTPNSGDALEAAILARLKERFPTLSVELYPDNPGNYRLKHPKGALLVRYMGSRYGGTRDMGLLVQERRLAVEITIFMRALHGDGGIGEVLEAVRLCLAGFAPEGFGKLRPLGDGFQAEDGGLWRYAVDFETKTTVVEETAPETAPLATKIDFNEGEK